MAIAKKIDGYIAQSSWIRRMFEAGIELKKQYGEQNVFDFSIGNPNIAAPAEVKHKLREIIELDIPNKHGYMQNAGYTETREMLAKQLCGVYGADIATNNVVMTCGAGGALNVILKTLLDPGDEVIIIAPFFVEYKFYIDNFSAIARVADSNEDFSLNLENVARAISPRTKALLINSPNNPTGKVYNEESIIKLAELLKIKSKEIGHTIYLISDEPYREIIYDNIKLPSVLASYEETIIAYSYSKSLSLPGERIGYILVNPKSSNRQKVEDGLIFCNRILGFVNAPALMQRLIAAIGPAKVNVKEYQRKRNLICDVLDRAGYNFIKPEGAFYVFPKSPIPDDVAFANILQENRILGVPGSGFGVAGYFRLAYCVDDATIINAEKSFRAALNQNYLG
ncbi:MAG: pyridoxal phosphate-dependent aminotransferase [Deltaproteobacteria bacterium]|nr:pyridoxal phosphate-dependent aminotransferase [Deltaproteobacteria bacterium]